MEGSSVNQVECRVQFQHQLTWQQALPPDLPVETVPKPSVGVLPLLFPLPDAWADILDDNSQM